MEEELVSRDVPVGDWLVKLSLKDHFSLVRPNLEKIFLAVVLFDDLLVYNLHQNRTEYVVRIVDARINHLVKVADFNSELDAVQVLFRILRLRFVQCLFEVHLLDLFGRGILYCLAIVLFVGLLCVLAIF